MEKIIKLVLSKKLESIADYFSLYRRISKDFKKIKADKKIKIAILAGSTVKGIKECLFVKCCEIGVLPDIYVADYNQYSQEILDTKSNLYKFKPDLSIVFIDFMSISGKYFFLPYQISGNERKIFAEEKLNELKSLISKIKENLPSKIILHNFEVPLYSPLGILENKQEPGFIESIKKLNDSLRDGYKKDSQIFVFDYDAFCSKIGKDKIIDQRMYYLADMKIAMEYIPALCDEYLSYIKPIKSLTRKCIVLDLDNTLWGGIIGEDGLEGIKLGATTEGRPFIEFQEYLLSLFNRGIILAINSKNNYDDVREVFDKHPDMVLKEKNFAAMQINWNDKISNMRAITKELNIGTDSMVFIDDDKANRQMIKEAFPEILVVDMPDDPGFYVKTLMELNDFNTLQLTEEDKKKGKMYAEQRKRNELQKSTTDITEYLRHLKMKITIEKANKFNIPRISQLTQKTNQFNMTTRRYLEEDVKKFSNSKNYLVFSVRVEDKFGDNGITGTAVVEKGNEKWRIDIFLLSCRVIGRKVEEALLAYIYKEAKKEKAKIIVGEFIPTKKNAPAKDFYKNNGFKLIKKEKDKEIWEYGLSKEYEFPDFIEMIVK